MMNWKLAHQAASLNAKHHMGPDTSLLRLVARLVQGFQPARAGMRNGTCYWCGLVQLSAGRDAMTKHAMPTAGVTHEVHPAGVEASIQPLSLPLHDDNPAYRERNWRKHLLACCVLRDARESPPPY